VLVLVKHSLPVVDPAVPPAQWHLGSEGYARCTRLAAHLSAFVPATVVSSTEPKAAETARAVTDAVELDERLREHDRSSTPWLDGQEFEQAVAAAFERPDEVVFGHETITGARERFGAAVDEHLARARDTLIVVAHGTVIAAYAAERADVDGFSLWRSLGLPSLVVLDGGRIVDVVEQF
jgi:broad specificity phosphatase PhoE